MVPEWRAVEEKENPYRRRTWCLAKSQFLASKKSCKALFVLYGKKPNWKLRRRYVTRMYRALRRDVPEGNPPRLPSMWSWWSHGGGSLCVNPEHHYYGCSVPLVSHSWNPSWPLRHFKLCWGFQVLYALNTLFYPNLIVTVILLCSAI